MKCDERPGVCFNCEKLGLACSGATPSSDKSRSYDATEEPSPVSTAGLKRKRTFRSCNSCRSTKSRCSGSRPYCARCRSKSLPCHYDDVSEPAWKQQLRMTAALQSQPPNWAMNDQRLTPEQSSQPSGTARTPEDDITTAGDVVAQMSTHQSHGTARQMDDGSSWLRRPYLPSNSAIRTVVEYFFVNIHPLRCFGFLHKPSFMQRLDAEVETSRNDDPLLLTVCALGALFYAAGNTETAAEQPATTLAAGSQWARRAQQLILAQLGNIMVENLMAAVLLHEYELRMGNFGNAVRILFQVTVPLPCGISQQMGISCFSLEYASYDRDTR